MSKTNYVLIIIIVFLILFSSISFSKTLSLQNEIGEDYKETIYYLDNRIDMIKDLLSRSEDLDKHLYYSLWGMILEYEKISRELPMKKNYFSYMFGALRGVLSALAEQSEGALYEENTEYFKKRALGICDKLQWSFNIIKTNAEKHEANYGYYHELRNLNSRTHKTLDDNLAKYLYEVLRIDLE